MPSTRRSSAVAKFPASGSSSRRRTRKEAEEVVAPATAPRSPASVSLSRRRTRNEAEEVVVAPAVATVSALGMGEEEGDAWLGTNTCRTTLRKRSVVGGVPSAAGDSSERPKRRMKKETVGIVSAAEDAEQEEVEVPKGRIEKEGDSSLWCCSRGQDVPRKRSSSTRPSASEPSSKGPRRKGKKAGKETVVLAVDEAASDEEDLDVEEDEVVMEEEGDDAKIEEGKAVMDVSRKHRVVASRKSAEGEDAECRVIGQPIEEKEAKTRWPKRYQEKAKVKEKNDLIFAFLACWIFVWLA